MASAGGNARAALGQDHEQRVARLLAEQWGIVPLPGSSGACDDPSEMVRFARLDLDAALEGLTEMPSGGWSDVRFAAALMVLGQFGDAYALASYSDTSQALGSGSLPTIEQTLAAAEATGVAAWCAELGSPLPGAATHDAPARRRVPPEEPSSERDAIVLSTLGYEIWSNRDGERPDWDRYAAESADAREFLTDALEGHEVALSNHGFTDSHSNEEICEGVRPFTIRGIARARRKFSVRVHGGAESETILATALLLILVRCSFLITTATDRGDFDGLHLVSQPRVAEILEMFGLTTWLNAPST